ncbi:hypothetical protein ACIQUY_16110 [Streptomyces sp. NPDC090231]|uniref:hypothetical protein n=1 Tax=unclassified Streptomyces TaxID=2593676 RepID=UPI0037F68FDB
MQSRHLNWHAALQSIACGDFSDARRRADTALASTDVGMRAATNWRLLLAGQSPAGRSDPGLVRELLAAPGGTAEIFHTFNLALALAVEAATDDLHILARRAAADERPWMISRSTRTPPIRSAFSPRAVSSSAAARGRPAVTSASARTTGLRPVRPPPGRTSRRPRTANHQVRLEI